VACLNPALKQAIILIFNETYVRTQVGFPATEIMPEIIFRAFRSRYPDYSMLEYINVIPEDYDRAEKMAIHVINNFRSVDPKIAITASVFEKMRLVPCTDLKQVKAFIDRYSPHAVQDRADWGVLLNRVPHQSRLETYNVSREPEMTPIAAACGYTKFLQINNGTTLQYLPICVITNVTANIPSTDILPMILPIVAGTVIARQLWLRPYSTFADQKPNLGRLLRDPQKKSLLFFKSPEEQKQMLANVMVEVPFLALDCAEGRARIPHLEKLVLDKNYIANMMSRFFGAGDAATFLTTNPDTSLIQFMNFEGSYKHGSELLDTRNADYINMVTDTKDYMRCAPALQQSCRPEQHLLDVIGIYGEDVVNPLYRIHTIVFNSALINQLAVLIGKIIEYQAEAAVNQMYDFNALVRNTIVPIGGANPIYGGGWDPLHYDAGMRLYQCN